MIWKAVWILDALSRTREQKISCGVTAIEEERQTPREACVTVLAARYALFSCALLHEYASLAITPETR